MSGRPATWRATPVRWRRTDGGPIRVAVVGGSTPFASDLFLALARAARDDGPAAGTRWDLRLLGRDARALEAVGRHAGAVLGGTGQVLATAQIDPALDGADVVIVQPRIGGLRERSLDEDLAASVRAGADEGLGVGGTRAVIRSAPALRGLAHDIRRLCPNACVIAFTNPLSTTVSVLHGERVAAVGVCELPTVTADEISAAIGCPPEEMAWEYSGLSHRGFIHGIAVDGHDGLPALVERLREASGTIGGIGADTIEALDAVPLKYHAMLSGMVRPATGRGRDLLRIRDEALRQLEADPIRRPSALAQRLMPWYEQAVVPVIVAAFSGRPSPGARFVLDVMADDGLVREVLATVGHGGAEPSAPTCLPPTRCSTWLETFERHETALTDFLVRPTVGRLAEVLGADPMMDPNRVDEVVSSLRPAVTHLASHPVSHHWLWA